MLPGLTGAMGSSEMPRVLARLGFGLGWAIGGVSTINRRKQAAEFGDTKAIGSPLRSVNFSSTEAFCPDGQRLLAVPATGSPPGCEDFPVLRWPVRRSHDRHDASDGGLNRMSM